MNRLQAVPEPRIPCRPPRYACARATLPPRIDGDIDKDFWRAAPWTDDFMDIEGADVPPLRTRAKMLWDDANLYIAAELEGPEIWAHQTERDSVIFHDNDFEIFLCPTGDNHGYMELELNARGTYWDLFLPKPYRDGGAPLDNWDAKGLQLAVSVDGALNDPAADNRRWCVEMAIPFANFADRFENGQPPRRGDLFRMNFSRVQWKVDVVDGRYVKRIDPATGRPYPEYNWVWAPTGVINIHYPEMWGYVRFLDEPGDAVALPDAERVRGELMRLYYRQRAHMANHDAAAPFAALRGDDAWSIEPRIESTSRQFLLSAEDGEGNRVYVTHEGRSWVETAG